MSDSWYSGILDGILGGIQNVGSVINEADIKSRNLFDYNIDDNTLGQSEYDFRYRVFPSDLANDYVGHYMVININVPVFAKDGSARTSYGGSAFGQGSFASLSGGKAATSGGGGAGSPAIPAASTVGAAGFVFVEKAFQCIL